MIPASLRTVTQGPSRIRRFLATAVTSLDAGLHPSILTASIPGPKSKEASEGISGFQDPRAHVLVCGELLLATFTLFEDRCSNGIRLYEI
jgi:hypothetical protein